MIKFFRKIRQKLVMENKTSKYFKYAIGEIVLVVIGILIALQISNWNQNQQNKIKETYYLKEMQKEFLKDQKTLERFTMLTEAKTSRGILVKNYLKNDTINKKELLADLFFNGKIVAFKSFTPVYDELVSSGQMSLLKNDSLKILIKEYNDIINRSESFLYKESQAIKEKYNMHLFKYFDYEIITKLWNSGYGKNISEDKLKGLKRDFEGFRKDPKSYYYVAMCTGADSELNRWYTDVITPRLNNILNLLNKEIKTFK